MRVEQVELVMKLNHRRAIAHDVVKRHGQQPTICCQREQTKMPEGAAFERELPRWAEPSQERALVFIEHHLHLCGLQISVQMTTIDWLEQTPLERLHVEHAPKFRDLDQPLRWAKATARLGHGPPSPFVKRREKAPSRFHRVAAYLPRRADF